MFNNTGRESFKKMVDFTPYDKKNIISFVSRLLVWSVLFSVLYILRSFFLLIFLTFVYAYIQVSIVNYIQSRWVVHRKVCVVATAVTLLCFFISVMLFLIPSVKRQTEVFISQFGTYIDRVDQEIIKLSNEHSLVKELIVQLELTKATNGANTSIASNDENSTSETYTDKAYTDKAYTDKAHTNKPDANKTGTAAISGDTAETQKGVKTDTQKNSPVAAIIQQVLGLGNEATGISNLNQLLEKFRNISGKIASIGSAFLLSLLFSFLIVFDLPNLTKLVKDLEHTRLDFFYKEVADNVKNFAQVLGKALEAQLSIAIVNSILTAFGLYFLGIGKYIAFLSVIVFFCSFIPVVGVFISSVPICLVTLQASGLKTMILAIILIIVIHLIEGYILNPRIYGSYMRINPVLVLIILTIGGKLFHIWGLILGVPVCTYIFAHAIRKKPEEDTTSTLIEEPEPETMRPES
ncbi:MAG: AI-2E family transporter [Desulfamplus sp.]|nr:AI-2E family transporter [Desulfamplus sp.]